MKKSLHSQFTILFGAAFLLVFLLLSAVLTYLYRDISTCTTTIDQEKQIDRISNQISLMLLSQLSRSLTSFSHPQEVLYPEFATDSEQIRELFKSYQSLDLTRNERLKVEEIKVKHQDIESMILYASTCKKRNELDQMLTETRRIVELSNELGTAIAELSLRSAERTGSRLQNLHDRIDHASFIAIGVATCSLLFFFLISSMLVRKYLSPLHELTHAASRVRNGDFTVQVPEGRVAEIHRISSSFNLMTDALREAETRRKANKLESIGILAGGIAHDFNNFLTAILGNISMAKRKIRGDGSLKEILGEAEMASIRAKELTNQLLTFAKGGTPVKRICNLGRLLDTSVRFVLRGTGTQHTISTVDDLWPVEADEGQISQVVNNLVINAEQAMPDGGIIKTMAENVTLEGQHRLPLPDGRYVKISIEDQGTGIPDNHLSLIFDPYFTTKQRGSGLGLTTAFSIIQKHGGYIDATSSLGSGTVFSVYLPATEKAPDGSPSDYDHSDFEGHGRILIMDDEGLVRSLARRLLEGAGFQVTLVADGEEALDAYGSALAGGAPYELVILDLAVQGGMGGKEAVKHLKELDPSARVIVSSGYTNDPVLINHEQYGFSGVVRKPYTALELERVIRQTLKPH